MGRSAPRLTCRVREARVEAGLSQQALASAVGVSRQALSAVEAGRTVPGTDVALRLASALGRRVETLFVAAPVTSQLVARPVRGSLPRRGARVLVAEIDHAWVARALDERGPAASQAADGVVLSARPGHLDVE